MALDLDEMYKDANPYFTNWGYLYNMAVFQVKLLEGMEWYIGYIHIGLPYIPDAWVEKENAESSRNNFIVNLSKWIMGL
jgi:hypothetical protein